MEIKKIIIEELENEGCNNGNYPRYTVVLITVKRHTAELAVAAAVVAAQTA